MRRMGGYDYVGQTVFASAFGGEEVVSIVERATATVAGSQYVYRLVATSKTSTLQKELNDLARDGFSALGMTVGQTALGGSELVVIAGRRSSNHSQKTNPDHMARGFSRGFTHDIKTISPHRTRHGRRHRRQPHGPCRLPRRQRKNLRHAE